MTGKYFARATALSLAFFLAACGGDENSTPLAGGGGGTGGDGGGAEEVAQVGSIQLFSSQPQIGTGGENQATITAVVKDSNNVLMEGVEVSFSADNGALSVSQPVTSESGVASANLSSAGDARNRTIAVLVSAGSVNANINIPATGTTLAISGPASIALNDSASYTITLRDSDNRGIQGQTVSIRSDGNSVEQTSTETNSSGEVEATVIAQSSGETTLSASVYSGSSEINLVQSITVSGDSFTFTAPEDGQEVMLGECQRIDLLWTSDQQNVEGEAVRFSSTRGGLFSSESDCGSATPDPTPYPTNVEVDISNNQATVYAKSNDAGFADITARAETTDVSTSRRIEFLATTPSTIRLNATRTQLSTGESADITATVRDVNGNLVKGAAVSFDLVDVTGGSLSRGSDVTSSQGQARTTYIAADTTSEKDAIKITARIPEFEAVDAKTINLTVGGQALTIVIGTGNTISAPSESFYNQPWGILVTDVNGNARGNQEVELSVLPTKFYTGKYVDTDPTDSFEWVAAGPGSDSNNVLPRYECTPTNENEDEVGSRWIANPASTPTRITTDESGSAEFNVNYPKSQCNWVRVRLTATARVDGEESQSTQTFTLTCLAEDLEEPNPPGGIDSFYGTDEDCSTQ